VEFKNTVRNVETPASGFVFRSAPKDAFGSFDTSAIADAGLRRKVEGDLEVLRRRETADRRLKTED
jgi:hypothetical protein